MIKHNPPGLIVRAEFDGSTLPVKDSDAAPNWKSLTAQLGFGKRVLEKESLTLPSRPATTKGIGIGSV